MLRTDAVSTRPAWGHGPSDGSSGSQAARR
jgi:hypothetical protein